MIEGYLRMMEYTGLDPVNYYLKFALYPDQKQNLVPELKKSEFSLNSILGKKIFFQLPGEIRCVNCGKISKKSFNRGSCYSCFSTLAKNDMCILRPTECHYHNGTCREPEWGEKNCFKKHTVYLANSSGLKVGITKENPVSNRWIDQGAMYALPIFEVESRKEAGEIEEEFAQFISDKTSWQKMISADSKKIDLYKARDELLEEINRNTEGLIENAKETKITYPILEYPKKKTSYKPEKNGPIEDILIGVKGQYLLFKKGVMNLRAYSGYKFIFKLLD